MDICRRCFQCNECLDYKLDTFSSNRLKEITVNCQNCNQEIKVDVLEEHYDESEGLRINYSICNEILKRGQFLNHLSTSHLEYFTDQSNLINEFLGTLIPNSPSLLYPDYNINEQINPLSKTVSKIGYSGKYYCSKPLDGPSCKCCDKTCGYSTGCNCSGCMELDIKYRRLPQGWLVNREGYASKQSIKDGNFFCGRKVKQYSQTGFCVSDDPFKPCSILNSQTSEDGRYCRLIR